MPNCTHSPSLAMGRLTFHSNVRQDYRRFPAKSPVGVQRELRVPWRVAARVKPSICFSIQVRRRAFCPDGSPSCPLLGRPEAAVLATSSEAGSPPNELCRRHAISEQSFYRWKAKYGAMDVRDAKKLRALEDANRRLNHIVAEQALDIAALKGVLGRKVTPASKRRAASVMVTDFRGGPYGSCRLVALQRSTYRYRSRRRGDDELREKLRELAHRRPASAIDVSGSSFGGRATGSTTSGSCGSIAPRGSSCPERGRRSGCGSVLGPFFPPLCPTSAGQWTLSRTGCNRAGASGS